MCKQADISEQKFWLHVPLESARGHWFQVPSDGKCTVLGHTATLNERQLPDIPLAAADQSVIRHWLLFDPLDEQTARSVFTELAARLPVLALRRQFGVKVPDLPLDKSPHEHQGMFNGPFPTLIPAEFKSNPIWGDGYVTSYEDGTSLLEHILPTCPAVTDGVLAGCGRLASPTVQAKVERRRRRLRRYFKRSSASCTAAVTLAHDTKRIITAVLVQIADRKRGDLGGT